MEGLVGDGRLKTKKWNMGWTGNEGMNRHGKGGWGIEAITKILPKIRNPVLKRFHISEPHPFYILNPIQNSKDVSKYFHAFETQSCFYTLNPIQKSKGSLDFRKPPSDHLHTKSYTKLETNRTF